jgi:hypothetical protein
LKIYLDIWPFHHKPPAALKIMKESCSLHDETICKTRLLEKVFSDFDNIHKQLYIKQKNDEVKGKKQKVFHIVQILSVNEAKKVFDVLLSTKHKLKSDEPTTLYEEKFGRNNKIQITTILYLT